MPTGFLTTHILDTAKGIPAKGVTIDLFRYESENRIHVKSMKTNEDGRTDSPLLPEGEMTTGTYELLFAMGDYFKSTEEVPFVNIVPIRFGISDPDDHYHVPLLASPFSYSTYRGS